MGTLIYEMITSLDGYINDAEGKFDWYTPDEELHTFVSKATQPVGDGPGPAATALRAGLVDEVGRYVCPVVVGGGTRFFPDDLRLNLELVNEHRFSNGVVHVHHRVR